MLELIYPKLLYLYGIFVCLVIHGTTAHAQENSDSTEIYKVHPLLEFSISAGSFVLAKQGFNNLASVSRLDIDQLNEYDQKNINSLDRKLSCLGNCQLDQSQKISDLALNITLIAPITLILDKEIRKDWMDLLALYVESEVINTGVYLGSAHLVRRARPLVYDSTLGEDIRTGKDRTNSFYSGHVGNTATATFFMAKVYTDYHRMKGWKRIGFYGLASLPPAFVGYHRIQAGKHFFTDVITGYLAGGLIGILVPELHRIKESNTMNAKVWAQEDSIGLRLTINL